MPENILEEYILQHIEASTDKIIRFSWHGGEPTILGLAYFQKILALQRKYRPADRQIANGMQTNGILLDEEWCRFLAKEGFSVGLSLDGPSRLHDLYRIAGNGMASHERALRGHDLLRRYGIPTDILCVVHADNVRYPDEVYGFFKRMGASYVTFLPLVEKRPEMENGVSPLTVPAEAWGAFLCVVFDQWLTADIGKIKVRIFEEAARTAFGQEHSLCLFRPTCGNIPVIEHNGDFFCCDHYVDREHCLGNIRETPLRALLEHPAQRTFGQAKLDTLPPLCRNCEVREMCHGECPKNRFLLTPDGEPGLNYLCTGYKRFFTHCRPFVAEVASAWGRQGGRPQATPAKPSPLPLSKAGITAQTPPGRNEPCPCGSGKKYKKCCLRVEQSLEFKL